MYAIPIKNQSLLKRPNLNNLVSLVMSFYSSKTGILIFRIIVCLLMIEVIAFSIFLKLWFFTGNETQLNNVSRVSPNLYVIPEVKVGSATEQFISVLKESGQNPIPLQQIKRRTFPVSGRIIALVGDNVRDNIQVFEYPDADTAQKETSQLALKYTSSTLLDSWKKDIHLYVKDKVAIYYFGNKKTILSTLNEIAGLSLVKSSIATREGVN